VSTEKRAFSVSWASWNRQKCPEIYWKKFSWNFTSCSWEPWNSEILSTLWQSTPWHRRKTSQIEHFVQ